MAKEIKGARFVLKRSNVPGDSPTIPPNTDHTTGLWIDTDIYSGEMFLNVADSKMWFRNSNETGSVAEQMVQLVPLNSGGTIDTSYLPGNYLGAMVYRGTWDASTSNPPSTTPEKGDYWIVSVSGNTDLDGITDWQIGDFAIYNGTSWDKIDNTEAVVYASDVLYDHSYFTSLTNADDALDFLLDRFNYYSGSTNITITDDTSGHGKTIALVTSPTITNLNTTNVNATGYINIGTNLDVGGNLHVTGTTNLYGSLTTTSNITSSGSIIANTLQTLNTLNFNTTSSNIVSDGTGLKFSQSGNLKLYFNTSSDTIEFRKDASTPQFIINNSTNISTLYHKLRYDSSKTLDNNLDLVNKEYLDNYVASHNVGLWSSGGTSLDNPYKIIAWDGINTHYVGINKQNPTYNLDVVGTTYLNGDTYINGDISMDVPNSLYVYGGGDGPYIEFTTSNIKLGDIATYFYGNYLQIELEIGQAHLLYYGSTPGNPVVFDVSGEGNMTAQGTSTLVGTVNIGQDLTVDGGINIGTDNADELILRGTHVTIANTGGPDSINLMFAGSSAFGNQTIGIQPTSVANGRILYIRGQNSTSSTGIGGALGIYGGNSANSDGGNLSLNGGNGGTGVGDNGGSIYVQAGDGYIGGDVIINAGNGTSLDGNINIGTSNTIGIYSNKSIFPIATPSTDEVLFIDSDNQIKRGNAGGGAISSYTNGANDRIITSTGASGINAETNLTYDGTYLRFNNVGGGIRLDEGNIWIGYDELTPTTGWIGWGDDAGGGIPYVYINEPVDDTLGLHGTRVRSIASGNEMEYSGSQLSIYAGTVNSGTENIRITSSGVIHANDDIISYSTTIPSDIRLKKNINNLENSLEKILKLQGVSYEWNEKEGNQNGFIAQDVEKIIPELIKETTLPLTGDEKTLYKTIKYNQVIPYLVESIKELKAEINELKNK